MAGYGMPQIDIAHLITEDGIDPKTLRLHFRKELDRGAPKANSNVAQRLYQKCMAGDITSIIWWEKTRSGNSASRSTARSAAASLAFPIARSKPARHVSRGKVLWRLHCFRFPDCRRRGGASENDDGCQPAGTPQPSCEPAKRGATPRWARHQRPPPSFSA